MLEAVLEIGAIPGTTPVHRLWAGTKLVAPMAVAFGLAFSGRIWAHAAAALLLVLAMAVARLSPALVWRGVRPLVVALAITAIVLMLAATGPAVLQLGWFSASQKGIETAVRVPGFLILLAVSANIVNRTTPTAESVAALGVLLHPLRRLRVPVDELLTMTAISLRFLPILAEEVTRLRQAQSTRGLSVGQGSLETRSKAIEGWMTALLHGNLRRAGELGEAMEARGYGDPEEREFPVQRPLLRAGDVVVLAGAVALIVAMVFIK